MVYFCKSFAIRYIFAQSIDKQYNFNFFSSSVVVLAATMAATLTGERGRGVLRGAGWLGWRYATAAKLLVL
jgi:hypothetical protein